MTVVRETDLRAVVAVMVDVVVAMVVVIVTNLLTGQDTETTEEAVMTEEAVVITISKETPQQTTKVRQTESLKTQSSLVTYLTMFNGIN